MMDTHSAQHGASRIHRLRALLAKKVKKLQSSLPAEAAMRFVEADLMSHAAALSFYALLSLAPLLILVL